MTQSSLQTQCPNCQTRFRVTEEQLGIAKGKVRCGNCMKVFNAIEHQVIPGGGEKPRPPATPAQPAGASSPAGSTSGSGVSEEDFVFADNPEEDAAEGPYAGTKLTFSDDELSDSFRSFDERDETDYKDADTDSPDEQVDESWAEAILQDDEPASRKPSAPQRPEPAPEPEPEDTSPEPEPRPEPRPELSLEEEPVFEQTGTPKIKDRRKKKNKQTKKEEGRPDKKEREKVKKAEKCKAKVKRNEKKKRKSVKKERHEYRIVSENKRRKGRNREI